MRRFITLFILILTLSSAAFIFAQENSSTNRGEKSSMLGDLGTLGKDRPKDAKTEITANKEATFDNASGVAEFVGRVIVRDPQFTLTCDRLKVTLNKNRKGMEVALAMGNVVIVQESTDTNGKTSKAIGRAGEATYAPATSEIKLRIWPSVQQGINNQVATEEGTVMILNRNGKSQTIGGSKTMISDTGEASSSQ